jgi:hypothetical protein
MHNFVIIGATPRLPPKGGMTGPTLAQNLATERHIEERGVVLMRGEARAQRKCEFPRRSGRKPSANLTRQPPSRLRANVQGDKTTGDRRL